MGESSVESNVRVVLIVQSVSYFLLCDLATLPCFVQLKSRQVVSSLVYVFFFFFRVHFTVTMAMDDLDAIDKGDGLHKYFKLESALSTTNMVLFDQDGQLIK